MSAMNRSHRKRALSPEVRTLAVNGYEMTYCERGHGVPLVLVHGSLNDYRAWEFQMKAFGSGYRTIAVSLRRAFPERWDGEGGNFSVRQHADDLAAFVTKLGTGPVHLAAHSRGGDVALILASEHPQLVRSVVLADPAPLDGILPKRPEVRAAAEKRKAVVTRAIKRLQQGDLDGGLEIFIDAVNASGNWKKFPESVKQIRRDNAWSLISLLADAQVPFTCTDAHKIDAPILLVTGAKSPGLYGMMHAALQQCLRRYQKVTIAQASHGMHRDNPDAFNAAVLTFLANCEARQEGSG